MKLIEKPETALDAWITVLQASSHQISPDILLTLYAYNNDGQHTLWGGRCMANEYLIEVMDNQSMASVLSMLYDKTLKTSNLIPASIQETINMKSYSTAQTLDRATRNVLDRLVWGVHAIFKEDWKMMMTITVDDVATSRTQIRLVARHNTVLVGGRGMTLRDSATELYHNATPYFSGIQ